MIRKQTSKRVKLRLCKRSETNDKSMKLKLKLPRATPSNGFNSSNQQHIDLNMLIVSKLNAIEPKTKTDNDLVAAIDESVL